MTYPDVPDLPGVPPLLRDPAASAFNFAASQVTSFVSPAIGAARSLAGIVTGDLSSLMGTGDDIGGQSDSAASSWGLFDSNGQAVITPDSFLGVEYRNSTRISNYPLERGAFESYNKVNNPFDLIVGMSCGGDIAQRADFLATAKALAQSMDLYTLVTPEEVFESVNIERYDYARKVHNGAGLILINFYLTEIRVNTESEFTNQPDSTVTVDEAAAATTAATADTATPAATVTEADAQNPASVSPQSQGQTQAAPATSEQAAAAPATNPAPTAPPDAPSKGALKVLPTGYTQDPQTGLIRDPGGMVDRDMSIRQGGTYIGPGPG
jgi:hypothetical protein